MLMGYTPRYVSQLARLHANISSENWRRFYKQGYAARMAEWLHRGEAEPKEAPHETVSRVCTLVEAEGLCSASARLGYSRAYVRRIVAVRDRLTSSEWKQFVRLGSRATLTSYLAATAKGRAA